MARLVFLGTPDAAVAPLRGLVQAGHHVNLVVSRPDRRRGRNAELSPSPVKAAALELGLAVTEQVDDALVAGADLGVVVAYGRLIKPHVLAALPMVNLHFSLLPRWRGAAPVQRAILAGDRETGVCLMALEEGLDTGGIYAEERVTIGPEETAADLRTRLVGIGTRRPDRRKASRPTPTRSHRRISISTGRGRHRSWPACPASAKRGRPFASVACSWCGLEPSVAALRPACSKVSSSERPTADSN